ncbi:hypothetical protein GCM10010398_21980 [Streptomyces fimbriatus]
MTRCQCPPVRPLVCPLVWRVRRQPKGPGKSIDVVRRPVLFQVYRGPFLPPVVRDHERLLMLSRTPGRIRKLLRNVSGIPASLRVTGSDPVSARLPRPGEAMMDT